MTPTLKRVIAGLLLAASLAACGGDDIDLATAPDPSDNFAIVVPRDLGGLTARLSKKATDKLKKEATPVKSYARDVQVFELRNGKELRAALEVVRLAPDARVEDLDFKRKLVGLIGGTSRKPRDVNGIPVFQTKQNNQHIFVWFYGRFMQVLLVRASETAEGQAIGVDVNRLLSEALALKPTKIA